MAEAAAPGVNLYQVVLIVSSYVRRHQLGLDQLIGLIVAVHRALAVLGLGPPPLEKPPEPDHPTISAARLCRVSRMRVSRPGTAPSFVGAARARGCCVSYPLEFTVRSPSDGASLFGSPLSFGEADRARPPAGPGRAAAHAQAAATSATGAGELSLRFPFRPAGKSCLHRCINGAITIGVNATPPGSHPAGSMLPPAGRDADRSVARSRDRCRRRRANR